MLKEYFNFLYNKAASKFRRLPFIRNYPGSKELIKYSIVGNFSNFLDLVLYIFLTRISDFWHTHYLLANALTMVIGSVIRFALHKKWTFRHDGGSFHGQYIRFMIVMFGSMILTEFLLFLAVEHLAVNDIIGKILAMGVVTAFCYYLTKVWVFKKGTPLK
jgi:putative flippase GtrA